MGSLAKFIFGKIAPRFAGQRLITAGTTRAARRAAFKSVAQLSTKAGKKKALKTAGGLAISIASVAAVRESLDGVDDEAKLNNLKQQLRDTIPGIDTVQTLDEALDLIKLFSLQHSLSTLDRTILPTLFQEAAGILRCAHRVSEHSQPSMNVASHTLSDKRQLERYAESLNSCLYLIGYYLGVLDVDSVITDEEQSVQGVSGLENLLKGVATARSGISYDIALQSIPVTDSEFTSFKKGEISEIAETAIRMKATEQFSGPRDVLMWILDTYL